MLLNFGNFKTIIDIKIDNGTVSFSDERKYFGSVINTNGRYEVLNNQFIAIFSNAEKNYLYLKDKLIELTPSIGIEYKVAQDMGVLSWFKIYDKEDLIFEITYINPHKPFVLPDPFYPDEDFNTTNFAYHLANYINKVKENPGIILFPNNVENSQI
jgi:hypothetical protein